MKTVNDTAARPFRVPRLPAAPRPGFEGFAHLVLVCAALAMVGLLLTSIQEFIPRAGTFADRLRETPEMLVAPSYALRSGNTNRPVPTVANTRVLGAKPVSAPAPASGGEHPAS